MSECEWVFVEGRWAVGLSQMNDHSYHDTPTQITKYVKVVYKCLTKNVCYVLYEITKYHVLGHC